MYDSRERVQQSEASLVITKVGTTLKDLGLHFTQDVLLATDQRLQKPFF